MPSWWQNFVRLQKCSIGCGIHVYMGSKYTHVYENSDQRIVKFFLFMGYTGIIEMVEIVVSTHFTTLSYTLAKFCFPPLSFSFCWLEESHQVRTAFNWKLRCHLTTLGSSLCWASRQRNIYCIGLSGEFLLSKKNWAATTQCGQGEIHLESVYSQGELSPL